jgi:hypothetical protein
MSFPTGRTVYTFGGVSFDRPRQEEMQPWMEPELQYTKDAVRVTPGSPPQVYIDIGADVAPLFAFRARCLTATDRFNLRGLRGTTGVLSNTRGRSATVLLVKAAPIDGLRNQLYIDLAFEMVSS